jgi:hypothetical protein
MMPCQRLAESGLSAVVIEGAVLSGAWSGMKPILMLSAILSTSFVEWQKRRVQVSYPGDW